MQAVFGLITESGLTTERSYNRIATVVGYANMSAEVSSNTRDGGGADDRGSGG